jgi:hypothetical protein
MIRFQILRSCLRYPFNWPSQITDHFKMEKETEIVNSEVKEYYSFYALHLELISCVS